MMWADVQSKPERRQPAAGIWRTYGDLGVVCNEAVLSRRTGTRIHKKGVMSCFFLVIFGENFGGFVLYVHMYLFIYFGGRSGKARLTHARHRDVKV